MRFLFHRRGQALRADWEPEPWWRRINRVTLDDLEYRFWAVASTFSLVLGLCGGVTLLVFKFGSVGEVSLASAPIGFVIAMLVNLAIAAFCWAKILADRQIRRHAQELQRGQKLRSDTRKP